MRKFFGVPGGAAIRASYGLSPMQSGMLFEALLHARNGQAAGFNVEQVEFVLHETLDCAAFARAWTCVARRHAVLSSAFRWQGSAVPMQDVHAGVVVPLEHIALDAADDAARVEAVQQFLARDRERGFDLSVPPLMRISVLASAAQTHVVWTFHHILLDGRSFPIVLREVFASYRAEQRGQAARLPEPPRPYADFIHALSARDPEPSRAYFRTLLRGKSAPTPLPTAEATGRSLPRTGHGNAVFAVSQTALRSAEALAASTATTLATVVQAAWALVLSAFTGDDDVVFGATRACRRSALDGNTGAMVGLFMNTLPVRTRTAGGLRVADLLHDLRQQGLALRAHEHTPLTDAQSVSDMPRGSALFETLVMFENQALDDTLRAGGDPVWHAGKVVLHEQPSLALSAIVVHAQAGLELRLLFGRKRFSDAAIARLGAAFCAVFERLGRDADALLGDIDALPLAERERIVNTWNDTARAFPDQLCLHEPFERRADLQPPAAALEFAGETLSYAELEARANQLAHALRQRGAQPGVYVGLCLQRGFELVVSMLGIAKSGAAYLPLDPEHPRERLAFMVEDAAVLMVVTELAHESLFSTPTLVVDGDDRESIAAQPATRLARVSKPTDVCYAIFTSGSTGQPKGVVLNHRAVINTFDWVTRTFEVGPGDRLLFVTSPCFDLSVYDTFGALGAGATVVIADRETLRDPALLAAAIVERRITIWDSAPAALQRLTPFFPPPRSDAALRRVLLSGDWIPLTLPDAIRASFPNAQVESLGGATEAAIWSNGFSVGAVDPRWASVPYGRPIQNARYHVLDARLRPVPVGVGGDLYIGGACLAEGYLNRPVLTAERFIADPLRPDSGERLYKTGDLARYLESGDLEFLGRSDFQVKIRGFRVEIGEVEIALRALDGVRDAICAAFVDAAGQKALAAYVVSQAEPPLECADVKARLAKRLPDYMLPSVVVRLDALPLSSNGKVDRKALPSPSTAATSECYQAPRTDFERALTEIWQRVLQRAPIGIHDNFFELGGHSMLAVTMMSEIQQRLGLAVPLSRIVECPSIALLAASQQGAVAVAVAVEPSPSPSIQVLRPGGAKRFFFIHDGDGEILLYLNLAKRLPAEYAVYGVTPLRRGEMLLAHASISEMAACYVQQVRAQQPAGPYRLAGLCAGGVIAFEMARQLELQGEQVDMIGLLDVAEPSAPRKRFVIARRRLARMLGRWQPAAPAASLDHTACDQRRLWKLLRQSARCVRNLLAHEATAFVRELGVGLRFRVFRRLTARGKVWPAMLAPLTPREIYCVLRDQYAPEPTGVRSALLVRAAAGGSGREESASAHCADPQLGWRRHVRGELHVFDAPGGHSSMLQEPVVEVVARALVSQLTAAPTELSPAARSRVACAAAV